MSYDPMNDIDNDFFVSNKARKNVSITINSYSEFISAFKCLLWSFDNNPSSDSKIMEQIYINKDNVIIPILIDDNENYCQKLLEEATRNNNLFFQKIKINGQLVKFYNNPTNKRMGYFLDGKLRTLRDIEKKYNIPFTTLHSRLKKMNIDQAVKK